MTLDELYRKLPAARHAEIHECGNVVVYFDGSKVLVAYVDQRTGELVPADLATRNALAVIGAG
jgi:hypothetical protein